MHIENISWFSQQPNTGKNASPFPGDSLIIKNAKTKALLLDMWGQQAVAGWQQITYPTAHDPIRGWRYDVGVAEVEPRMPKGLALEPNPQETLAITVAGSNTATVYECGSCMIYYKDFPGIDMHGISYGSLISRMKKMTTLSATITGAANPIAAYTGSENITAESDLLIANRDYAVLGATVSINCVNAWMQAPDFGNVRVAVPGNAGNVDFTRDYFCNLARFYDLPIIPVFNSGNKGAINIGIAQTEVNVSPLVTWYLALL